MLWNCRCFDFTCEIHPRLVIVFSPAVLTNEAISHGSSNRVHNISVYCPRTTATLTWHRINKLSISHRLWSFLLFHLSRNVLTNSYRVFIVYHSVQLIYLKKFSIDLFLNLYQVVGLRPYTTMRLVEKRMTDFFNF